MAKVWQSPIYSLKTTTGKAIRIDVTSSVSPGLKANKVVKDRLIPLLSERGMRTILDFGAGALRHTLPLLAKDFEVCAVEFEECFERDVCRKKRDSAEKHPNFTELIWPKGFLRDGRRFDAALLCYVLQTMPLHEERQQVLKALSKKLNKGGYLLYMSRFGQPLKDDAQHRVKDGAYRYPERDLHSFYREFTTDETHDLFRKSGFERVKSWSERGTDQVFLYHKPNPTFV